MSEPFLLFLKTIVGKLISFASNCGISGVQHVLAYGCRGLFFCCPITMSKVLVDFVSQARSLGSRPKKESEIFGTKDFKPREVKFFS
jgi:hypothetical protein